MTSPATQIRGSIQGTLAGPGDGVAARLARSGGAAFVVYLTGHGLAFLTQVALARVLGASSYGIYAYVIAWLSVATYVAMLGQNIALLRFIPAYVAARDWPHLAGVVRYAERRVVATSLLLTLAGAGVIAAAGRSLAPELAAAFVIGLPLILLWSLTMVRSAMLRAFGGVVSALVPIRIVREGVVFAGVAAIALSGFVAVRADTVLAVAVAGSVLALAAASLGLVRRRPPEIAHSAPRYEAALWRAAALPLLVVSAVEALFDKTGVLVLGLIGNNQDAGVYALVFNISLLVLLPRTAIDTLFAPMIARLHAEGRRDDLHAAALRGALLSFLAGLGIAAVLAVVAAPLLAWFGAAFEGGVDALRLLLLAQVLAVAAGSQLTLMAMTGNERGAARILVASTAAGLAACLVLASQYGLTGAAVATAAAIGLWNALMAASLWRTLRLLPGIAALLRPAARS